MLVFGYFAVFAIGFVATLSDVAAQNSGPQLGMFLHKPYGPFYCKASCVALCLETKMAPNISSCVERFCSNFDENTPCHHYDASCWHNCGRKQFDDSFFIPMPVQHVEATFDDIDGVTDPYSVRIKWKAQENINLYIIEIFPIKTAFGLREEKVVQMMTTSNSYLFQRPDMCGVYMARLMAVNGFGLSTPSYKRLNEWNLPLSDTNMHIRLRSMQRTLDDPFPVRVLLDYKQPSAWEDGDVEIVDSNVRAFDCNFPIQSSSGFGDTEPDEDGFYWPLAFINESNSSIEINLPADVMYPQCKFLYKLLTLKTRCGAVITLDEEDKANEVAFALNCNTVENARCDDMGPSQTSNPLRVIVDPLPSSDDSNGDYLRPMVFGKPYFGSDNEQNRSSRPPPSTAEFNDNDDEQNQSNPPSPWNAEAGNNDTLWTLFESFLRGLDEGMQDDNDEAKERRRKMPEAPGDTPFPEPPSFPSESESQEDSDNLTKSFEKAFVESIDGPSNDSAVAKEADMVTPEPPTRESPEMIDDNAEVDAPTAMGPPAELADDIALPKMESTTGTPSMILKEAVADESSRPIQVITTRQMMSFVILVTVILVLVVIVVLACVTRQRPRRKEFQVLSA